MKLKLVVLFLALLQVSFVGVAQDSTEQEMQTLFGEDEITYGGYGGVRIAYSQFNGNDAWLVGGRGGVIFNSTFIVGGGGYGIVNSPSFSNVNGNDMVYLEGGYGGMFFEYIFKPNKVVHLNFPVIIGAGGLLYSDVPVSSGGANFEDRIIDNSAFFVLEPGVEVELNVVKFMRVAAGVSYRYANGLNLVDTPSSAFNSLTGSVTFKFGKF
ncbi:MAG: hypothetical protein ACLFNU_08000 [Bacteroidales bacterium]